MATEQVEIRDLQEGNYVLIQDDVCEITDYSTSKPGKHGSAKARIEADGVFEDKHHVITEPVDAKINIPRVNRKKGQVVNVSDDEAQIMDLDDYDTFTFLVPEDIELDSDDEVEYLEHESQRKLVEVLGDDED